ncbi:hypothetical protein F4604DRAFT_1677868 [Suillus subluteus]|nr:hypothetical protein F4604DRAFT_1677868 [Suillus subluteus]
MFGLQWCDYILTNVSPYLWMIEKKVTKKLSVEISDWISTEFLLLNYQKNFPQSSEGMCRTAMDMILLEVLIYLKGGGNLNIMSNEVPQTPTQNSFSDIMAYRKMHGRTDTSVYDITSDGLHWKFVMITYSGLIKVNQEFSIADSAGTNLILECLTLMLETAASMSPKTTPKKGEHTVEMGQEANQRTVYEGLQVDIPYHWTIKKKKHFSQSYRILLKVLMFLHTVQEDQLQIITEAQKSHY